MSAVDRLVASRRDVLRAGALGIASLGLAGIGADRARGAETVDGVAEAEHLVGSGPPPSLDVFDSDSSELVAWSLIYTDTDSDVRYLSETGDDGWRQAGTQYITTQDDLPAPSNGTISLETGTVYAPRRFVTLDTPLELATTSPIVGRHGSVDGFIYTGGGALFQGTDAGLFLRDAYFHAPAGTMFDLTAANTVEMLVESCAFSDAAGIANIADLGTIDGYRVPTFKGCNFEDFDAGLTFDGDSDKIFIWGSPFRNITASNVKMLTLASTSSCELVDFADNYIKDVQSDTEVWHVEAGGEPGEVLQYRGTLHDASFGGGSQAITGALDIDSVGVRVSDSFPLTDWAVNGDLDIDGEATVPSAGADTEVVSGNFDSPQTFTLTEGIRTSKDGEGKLQYDAEDRAITRVFIVASIEASNTTASVSVGKNGTVLERSRSLIETQGGGTAVSAPATTNVRLETGDSVSMFVRDEDGSRDITIRTMALTLGPA